MCELLGLAFNEPVTPRISFRGFRRRGRGNPHGWGLAWFSNGQAEIRKEPAPADTSAKAGRVQMEEHISSPVFIGHVRFASCGDPSLANTHPFQRDFRGAPVVFAHNGTLTKGMLGDLFQLGRFRPEGETDSEEAFCHFLSWMDDQAVSFSDFARIEDWLRKLNGRGNMNLLFSNGTELFAYRDRGGYNGLCFTYRSAPFAKVSLVDEDWKVNLAQDKPASERGFIVATRPLTDETWINLRPGGLLVLRGGEAVYGDPRT